MMMMNNMIEHFEQRIAALTDIIDDVDRAFYNRDMVALKTISLRDLEQESSQLCADITRAPREIAQQMQPLMAEFIAKLEQLEQHLEDFKKNMQDQNNGEF